jgi:SAM-dependent methyltransferase
MTINKTLLSLLISPDDKSLLIEQKKGTLISKKTNIIYNIKNEIPLLYPNNIDMDHLHEEEHLAEMMRRKPTSKKDIFSLQEWDKSKKEFWHIFTKELADKKNKTILYLGCGFDAHAHEFIKNGHTFINFDMIVPMLEEQQRISKNNTNVAGDINALPFQVSSIDYIICIDVIHHEYYSLQPLLKNITDLLAPGGKLFLEDPNAWALFQWPKSIFLPKPLYIFLRRLYHAIKKSVHKPADYEFPTSLWKIQRILKRIEMLNIQIYPQQAYPETNKLFTKIYRIFSYIPFIAKYCNYHYMISATKKELLSK